MSIDRWKNAGFECTVIDKDENSVTIYNGGRMTFEELKTNIIGWANDRSLIKRTNATKQALKMVEEVGETCGALIKNNEEEIKDGIGDILVTVIILAEQLGYSPEACLELAWNEIKDRTGKTVGGTFIKSE